MKNCCNKNCLQINPQELNCFYKAKKNSEKLRSTCKRCVDQRNTEWARNNPKRQREISEAWKKRSPEAHKLCEKTWRQNNPDKIKDNALKYDFGITLVEYNLMLDKQNHCCFLCEVHESKLKSKLAVDHCHISNKIRGLLCNNCNRGIGHLKHNIKTLTKAIKYLE